MRRDGVIDALKSKLVDLMVSHGAYEVRVADPHAGGFEHSTPARHPLALMPQCRSVIVFAVPRPPEVHFWNIASRRSIPKEPGRLEATLPPNVDAEFYYAYPVVFLLLNHVSIYAMSLLMSGGYQAFDGQTNGAWLTQQVHAKLCAHEAGLGVYGRSGLILHPRLGNRIAIGVVLTDAALEPDPKLQGYEPCQGCSACSDGCPGGAYEPDGCYHGSWSKQRCLSAPAEGAACVWCWECCPACRVDEKQLLLMTCRCQAAAERLGDSVRRMTEATSRLTEGMRAAPT